MDAAGEKFFKEILAKKEKDRIIWNHAQEFESGSLSSMAEDAIMERMFLVNTILNLQNENERLRHDVEIKKGHNKLLVKSNVDYQKALNESEAEIKRLRLHLGWDKE